MHLVGFREAVWGEDAELIFRVCGPEIAQGAWSFAKLRRIREEAILRGIWRSLSVVIPPPLFDRSTRASGSRSVRLNQKSASGGHVAL